MPSRKLILSAMVAAGRSFTAPFKSLLVLSSATGSLPGLFFGARDSPLLANPTQRLTEKRLTPKRRAVSDLHVPRSKAATTFLRRPSEQNFIAP